MTWVGTFTFISRVFLGVRVFRSDSRNVLRSNVAIFLPFTAPQPTSRPTDQRRYHGQRMITSIRGAVGEVTSARSDRRTHIVAAHARAGRGIVFVSESDDADTTAYSDANPLRHWNAVRWRSLEAVPSGCSRPQRLMPVRLCVVYAHADANTGPWRVRRRV
jgi:hypothetical protein